MNPKILFLIPLLSSQSALAAKPITITVVSSLDFGEAPQGDAAKAVPPSTSETATNASFLVDGQHNTAYTITLPSSASLTTGGGGAGRTISLSSFLSYPAAGANGLLSSSGQQNLFVGATRDALLSNQVTGSYSGSFMVTVVY